MKRKLLWGLVVPVLIISVALSALMLVLIFDQYQDTRHWDTSPLIDEIHNVPPALASNYIPLDDRMSLEVLAKVNGALAEIAKDGEIKQEHMVSYTQIYDDAINMETQRGLEGSDIMVPTHRLGLYIDIERALEFAYVDPTPSTLQDVSYKLATYMLDDAQPLDDMYYARLSKVADDYRALQKFSKDALSKLGIVEATVLTVDVNVTYDMTHALLEQITTHNLGRFEHVAKLEKVLKSDEWSRITKQNASIRKYYKWMESKDILESLMKADYVPVRNMLTYSDAIAYNIQNKLQAPQGYIIDPNSPILQITYNGRILSSNEYVKRGTELIFEISPEYILVDIPVEDVPEIQDPAPIGPEVDEEPMEGIDE